MLLTTESALQPLTIFNKAIIKLKKEVKEEGSSRRSPLGIVSKQKEQNKQTSPLGGHSPTPPLMSSHALSSELVTAPAGVGVGDSCRIGVHRLLWCPVTRGRQALVVAISPGSNSHHRPILLSGTSLSFSFAICKTELAVPTWQD